MCVCVRARARVCVCVRARTFGGTVKRSPPWPHSLSPLPPPTPSPQLGAPIYLPTPSSKFLLLVSCPSVTLAVVCLEFHPMEISCLLTSNPASCFPVRHISGTTEISTGKKRRRKRRLHTKKEKRKKRNKNM